MAGPPIITFLKQFQIIHAWHRTTFTFHFPSSSSIIRFFFFIKMKSQRINDNSFPLLILYLYKQPICSPKTYRPSHNDVLLLCNLIVLKIYTKKKIVRKKQQNDRLQAHNEMNLNEKQKKNSTRRSMKWSEVHWSRFNRFVAHIILIYIAIRAQSFAYCCCRV